MHIYIDNDMIIPNYGSLLQINCVSDNLGNSLLFNMYFFFLILHSVENEPYFVKINILGPVFCIINSGHSLLLYFIVLIWHSIANEPYCVKVKHPR